MGPGTPPTAAPSASRSCTSLIPWDRGKAGETGKNWEELGRTGKKWEEMGRNGKSFTFPQIQGIVRFFDPVLAR